MSLLYPRRPMPLAEFRAHKWQPPELVIEPWLPRQGIAMIYGPTGVGKTFFSLALALGVAEGHSRLPEMQVSRPAKVLYVDAEMPPGELVARFDKLDKAQRIREPLTSQNLYILSHAAFPRGIPDLAGGGDGRDIIEDAVRDFGTEVLWLDNKSTLLQSGDSNSEDSLTSFVQWLLDFRRDGVSVVLVHHAGKRKGRDEPLTQRGTSKLTDIMDAVLQLDKLPGAQPARLPFSLRYEKHRHWIAPEEGTAYSACYDAADSMCWFEKGGADQSKEEPEWVPFAKEYRKGGHTVQDTLDAIASKFGNAPSPATFHRWVKRTVGDMA